MKRNLDAVTKKNKNQRGVAVIFTLGILGLLTVMALGFASTALLNNSLSKNVMNNAYARSLAKNLALTQAMYIISDKEIRSNGGFVDYRNVYSWGPDTDANSKNHKDFLWKLDYTDAGVQIYKYEPDKTSDNPANNVRWQYVKDTSATPKIIGRYAYVVIPDRGRIDPSVNIGRLASSPGEAEFSTASLPSLSEDNIKKEETLVSPPSAKWNSAYNTFRWMTFRELLKKASDISSDNDKKYLFQYKGVNPSLTMKAPEAYRKDGKLYSRFNMNRSDWTTMTVDKLCGIKSKSSSGSETTYVYEDLKEFPDKQTFIPWLQEMHKKSDALKVQAHQIAANIIQYNRPGPADSSPSKTISDKMGDSDDWLTGPPTYAGIGRHPMLNEIGVVVTVSAELKVDVAGEDPDKTYTYTPTYRIQVDPGIELINLFEKTGKACTVKFSGSVTVKYNKLKANADQSDFETEEAEVTFSGNELICSIPTDKWIDNVGYTKAIEFWFTDAGHLKEAGEAFELKVDKKEDIKKALKIKSVTYDLKNAVLYYDGTGTAKQRDFAVLPKEEVTEESPEIWRDKDQTEDGENKKQWYTFVSFETKDPLVNRSDWVVKNKKQVDGEEKTYHGPYKEGDSSTTNSFRKCYPGTVYDEDGTIPEPEVADNHKNAEVETDPAYTSSRRLETAFIRHGQMLSFWELGCISRREAWKMLNLLKKDNSDTLDFSYDKGDAVLFDQLKFTDENYTAGKINLNTDVHQVLERIFDRDLIEYKKDLKTITTETHDLMQAGTEDSSQIKVTPQTLNDGGAVAHSVDNCLACQLINATKTYSFQNRGDLMSTTLPAEGGSTPTNWTTVQDLLKTGATDLEKVQIAAKIMPLLRTDPVDMLYVVILAQSIRDVGGNIPVLVDWDGKGIENTISGSDNIAKAMFKAGYRRTITGSSISSSSSFEPENPSSTTEPDSSSAGSKKLFKTYTKNAIGTYDLGRDKITGETRLVATLVRDPDKRKWKLVRLQYVE